MSRYDYLLYGPEWYAFCRPKEGAKDGDLAYQISQLSTPSFQQMLHNYMIIFSIDANELKLLHTQAKRVESDLLFSQFEEFLKKLKIHFKALKKQVKSLIEI
jgi:hypothetical protein